MRLLPSLAVTSIACSDLPVVHKTVLCVEYHHREQQSTVLFTLIPSRGGMQGAPREAVRCQLTLDGRRCRALALLLALLLLE